MKKNILGFLYLFLLALLFLFPQNVLAATCKNLSGATGTCKSLPACDTTDLAPTVADSIDCQSGLEIYCCVPKTTGITCADPNKCESKTCPDRTAGFTLDSWCANNKSPNNYCCQPLTPTSPATNPAAGTAADTTIQPYTPPVATETIKLQLQIPLSNLSELTISGSTIGDYIKALFTFGSSVVVVVAIVMIIIGGVRWIVSGGDSGKIGQAKSTIIKALLGLFISLFAIFVLQIVSPGTITFQPITPPEQITAQYCCQSGTNFYFSTQADCKGKIVSFDQCQGAAVPTAQQAFASTCNGKDPLAQCYASACGQGDAAGLTASSNGGVCLDTSKPICCTKIGPLLTCDASTKCQPEANWYCASKGANQQGSCFPKRENGANCSELVLGDSTYNTLLGIFGGGTNAVCLSGNCSGGTLALCAPKDFQGQKGAVCTSNLNCVSGLFCACHNFLSGIASDGNGCTGAGVCTPKAPNGTACFGWVVNDYESGAWPLSRYACQSNCCIGALFGASKCADKAECEAN
ncbi:MAG: hypothetical protein WC460_03945 [Patescibacteria group bacterium]